MEEELSDDQVDELCMFMRVIDLFDKNKEIIEKNPEIVKANIELREKVNSIMDLLTDEQKDRVLEEHKLQSEYVAKQIEKDKKKAEKKKLKEEMNKNKKEEGNSKSIEK